MMVIEVAITAALVLFVAHILYHKVIKNVSKGCCCSKDGKFKKKCNK
ncbi:hypothetical protein [Clostridium butyricum]|nr:hypothetical protein [Clostridium butyricum]NOW22659.1 hypothetical protein [Clostridium butyricum]